MSITRARCWNTRSQASGPRGRRNTKNLGSSQPTKKRFSVRRIILKGLSPMGTISDVDDIVDAIVYLTEARHVTGEVLHVDAGAHTGKW